MRNAIEWGMVAFILALAALIASFSLACHIFGRAEVASALCAAYRETKHVTGTVARRGWRPILPWIFIAVAGGIGWRVVMGLPLTVDVVQLVGILGPLVVPTLLGQWTRSVETRAGVANGAGLVNPAALA